MSEFEFNDWQNWKKRGIHREARHRQPQLRQAAQAEPAMEALTGQKDWDLFLSLLQAEIQEKEAELADLERRDLDDPSMNNDVLMVSKARRLAVRAQIDTLEWVRSLPKTLIEEGREANRLLKEIAPDAA